ncbi:uncharacterized protein LOC133918113 [Phragmites australis]|uniref:uncharacterized protein LOC133918113 n=1 Tax=Phragmites australis TaxID=29695 RepID=UPI002D7887F9|nr:uncharacterized protein LOC133918113 [Phragmites australis]
MALDTYDCCVFPPLDWDWDWEMHALGGAGEAAAQEATFTATPGVESPVSSEASSGYLRDAVAHWGDRCNKRQRMAATPPPRRPATVGEDLQCLLESFWDSSAEGGDLSHDLNTTTIPEMEMSCSFVSESSAETNRFLVAYFTLLRTILMRGRAEEDGAGASGREEQGQRGPSAQVAAAQGEEEATAVAPPPRFSATVRAAAPLRLQKAAAGAAASTTTPGSACPSLLAGGWLTGEQPFTREKSGVGVLYPFAVVKPLGLEAGMTTLSDVNKRILNRPARPVRHPVGAFACGPAVSAHGLGLSGKAVVSLTRIRTGGKGTITIIRTRG